MHAMTAAHRSLPFGTRLRVTLLRSGRFVDVVVNDRGPYVGARIIDLSRMAAVRLGMLRDGLGEVRLEILAGKMSGGGTTTEDDRRPQDRRWQAKLEGSRGDVTAFEASLDTRTEDHVLR